jgi:hypothetical protein
MNVIILLEKILKIGVLLKDVANNKKVDDWLETLKSDAVKDVYEFVKENLDSIKEEDFEKAIESLTEKQSAIRGNNKIQDLSTDKLIEYSQLGNIKVLLAARQVKISMENNFLKWVVDDALPVLIKILPVVVSLL